jgi:hypothetical protein
MCRLFVNLVGEIKPGGIKQRTRLHHQHKIWERNDRDYDAKIVKDGQKCTD